MGTHRTWEETMSPQWKYLLQKESMLKKGGRKTAARIRREEKEKLNETSPGTIRDPSFKSTKKEKERDTKINKLLKEEYEKNTTP